MSGDPRKRKLERETPGSSSADPYAEVARDMNGKGKVLIYIPDSCEYINGVLIGQTCLNVCEGTFYVDTPEDPRAAISASEAYSWKNAHNVAFMKGKCLVEKCAKGIGEKGDGVAKGKGGKPVSISLAQSSVEAHRGKGEESFSPTKGGKPTSGDTVTKGAKGGKPTSGDAMTKGNKGGMPTDAVTHRAKGGKHFSGDAVTKRKCE